ncbi:hypothetical protein T4E_9778 [Trichinella pseudospiralis]|uniref:Uncharacterized protein n=1 Tax=Trichinella pseudospiralis TaxID=6337 RepID=A0A0V0XDV7_TRIPS|nr:hypothetical protein T4E_9778 [Trichinella pseudospiralis]
MPRQRNSNQRQEIMELKAFKQYGCLPLFDFDEFKDSFDIRLKKWNHLVDHQKLTTRKQHASESVDEWLSDLHSIATSCCCGDGETIRLLGQVIFGVNNDAVRGNLLYKSDILTLYKAVHIPQSLEMAS